MGLFARDGAPGPGLGRSRIASGKDDRAANDDGRDPSGFGQISLAICVGLADARGPSR